MKSSVSTYVQQTCVTLTIIYQNIPLPCTSFVKQCALVWSKPCF